MNAPLPRCEYDHDTVYAARRLLGCHLVHLVNGKRVGGTIVETEAYIGAADLGCHSARGRTPRVAAMFGPPGHAYIYLIYGMYYCFNAVTRPEGDPQAVLIRAIEPVDGIEWMREHRAGKRSSNAPADRHLADGPGKLCAALGIDGSLYGADLAGDTLRVEAGPHVGDDMIASGPRVGIPYAGEWAAAPLRFWIRGNPFVSRSR